MSPLFWLIIAILLAEFAWSRYLDRLNDSTWSPEVPDELKAYYDAEKYATAQAYHREQSLLSRISSGSSLAVILLMLFLKGFAALNGWAASITSQPILQTLIFFGVLYLVGQLLSLPFAIYGIFHIEDKYGFNKMTWRTFAADQIKSLLLTMVLGGGLLALITWFYYSAGQNFWWYAWIAVTAVSLFVTMFYTSLIVPLFNKLTPLPEGSLRSKIESFAREVGFPLQNISVIDGSRRSSKANAYFSGIGPRKSIVLFDTLIEDHTEEELVAILAHEIGHYKLKHIRQGLIISVLHTGLLLWLIGWFIGSAALSHALGVPEPNFHIGILAFGLLYSPISTATGLLMNRLSRRNEFQADAYAKLHYTPEPLMNALKKLSVKHLSNLKPHPLYVSFYYSHPPLMQRLAALRQS